MQKTEKLEIIDLKNEIKLSPFADDMIEIL